MILNWIVFFVYVVAFSHSPIQIIKILTFFDLIDEIDWDKIMAADTSVLTVQIMTNLIGSLISHWHMITEELINLFIESIIGIHTLDYITTY